MELSRRCRLGLCSAAVLLSAFLGVLFFSETTSPLYHDWGYDSAMFQTIGKYWAEGTLPYTGLFDHKGPVIFLINAAGYALAGRTGVFALQVVFLAASEWLAYRMLRPRFSRGVALSAALLLPVVLAANWSEGNTTEEYILPLLFGSYLCMRSYLAKVERGQVEHGARGAFLYGVCFAFALMTRATNALGVCVGVAIITAALAVHGMWRNLAANAAAFIAGAAVLIVPFCVYFAAHGALYDMWYGTLLFNLDYSAASGTEINGLVTLLVLLRRNIAGWCLIFAAAWGPVFKKRGRGTSAFWLAVAGVNTLFIYTLNDYAHYGIVLLPFAYLALCELASPELKAGAMKLSRALAVAMAAVVLISCAAKIYKDKTVVYPPQSREEYGDDYMPLLEMIPDNERDSFIAMDCPRRLYLKSGLKPAFRFFTLQQWMSVNSADFADMLHDEFAESRVRWVLRFELYDVPLVTEDVIAESYTRVASSPAGIYSLYRLND